MNPRRVAKSVRTHQATMAALGNAALNNVGNLSHSQNHPDDTGRMTNSNQIYSGYSLWRKPKSVSIVGSADQKIDRQQRKGLITQGEASSEKLENGLRNPGSFHSPVNAGDNVEKGGHKATVRKHIPTEDF
jgi:hypothetical protein